MSSSLAASSKVQCIVIGGGAIGVACARALLQLSRRSGSGAICVFQDVMILEKSGLVGAETSARNSEVIHAGIYYSPGSKKSEHCILGSAKLYDYLEERHIQFNPCGKIIVSTTESQDAKLMKIYENGIKNGANSLKIVDSAFVKDLEPDVVCRKAIWSPKTGIFDSHSYIQSLVSDFERLNGQVVFNCHVNGVDILSSEGGDVNRAESRFLVKTNQGDINCDYLINAAGLDSTFLARKISNFNKALIPRSYFAKGSYYKLSTRSPFSRLVYPIPENGGLGVHATIDLSGSSRFGPDVEWLKETHKPVLEGMQAEEKEEKGAASRKVLQSISCRSLNKEYEFKHSPPPSSTYYVDIARADLFYSAIRTYWPSLPDQSLVPDYSGIRPKLCGPFNSTALCSNSCQDFMIQTPAIHGIKGLVNLYGIESPGLTSSLSIAETVADSLR